MARRRGWLIALDLFLGLLALLGVLQAAAKDDTTAVEGIVFWVSLVALPILLLVLVGLLISSARALASRSARTS